MIVIYAEKPDMGRKIANALSKKCNSEKGFISITFKGKPAIVTWGYGHMCSLYDAVDYDADFKNWKNIPLPLIPSVPKLKVIPSGKEQFKIVKDLFGKADLIINATDWDREGEVIFSYIYEKTNCKKPFKRVCLQSTTEESIREAFDNLYDSSAVKNLADAGKCRSLADWIIGINMTTAVTLSSSGNTVKSIGRVQTPTLAMIVKREKEIRDFVPKKYYTVKAKFTTSSKETYEGDNNTKFDTEKDAKAALESLTGNATVIKYETKDETVDLPPLYNLSLLQMDANAKYGFTLAETLKIAQSLYEKGYTTYPRTTSNYLPDDYVPNLRKVLLELSYNPSYSKYLSSFTVSTATLDKRFFNSKKVDSHFAIIPTNRKATSLTPSEAKVYDLICLSVIRLLYPKAIVSKTKIVTQDGKMEFNTAGQSIKDLGWMFVGGSLKEKELPIVHKGENVNGKYSVSQSETQPQKRYTDKTIAAAMISAGKDIDLDDMKTLAEMSVKGIGTEATRAETIEKLIHVGYVKREKKSLYATDLGIALIDNLPVEEIKSAELTVVWENRLYDIAHGEDNPSSFNKDIADTIKKWCKTIEDKGVNMSYIKTENTSIGVCPVCGMNIRKTPFGWGCEGYKKGCKFTISGTIAGKKLTENHVKTLLTKGKTSEIKGFKSKAGKKFNAKLKLDDSNKISFDFSK